MSLSRVELVKVKSLVNFIDGLVNEFSYEDFQPPIEKSVLQARLKEILCKDTPYWLADELPPKWRQNWCAIHLKTFENLESVSIGINAQSRRLHFSVFNEISRDQFGIQYHSADIAFASIWKDHQLISSTFSNLVMKGLKFVESGRPESDFNWGEQ